MQTININNLYKKVSDTFNLKVDQLDLEVGKIYGLVGPNGAGKTTLMKCLCSLLRPDSGILKIDNRQVEIADPKILLQVGTNFVNSDSLNGFMLEDIYNDHAFYYKLKNLLMIETLLMDVGLNVNKKRKFNTMSLGMKQRFLLGLATAHNPSLVLLDEPFNGLDPDGVELFIENVKTLSENRVLIISSHILRDMETFLDDVIFIEKGNVQEPKSMVEIREEYREGLKSIMMNKRENMISDSKLNVYRYELDKIKNVWFKVFLITLVIQMLFFMFFSFVGIFDESADTISSFQGIIALSNTVSMCGISIYGAVLLRKELVRFYVGNHRNRTFLFPIDRKELLVKKTSSFYVIILSSFGSALLISFVTEVLLNLILKFHSSNLFFEIYLGLITIVTSCSLLFVILILSEIISIWKQSEIASIITSVVLMLIYSNFSAMGLMNFPTITFLFSTIMGLMLVWLFLKFSDKLCDMEVY